jgi:hypothetical protein
VAGPREKGGIKNEGISHYVIENKHKKISTSGYPIISMKIKALFFKPMMCMKRKELVRRHEKSLRERSSEPLGPEFCAIGREAYGAAQTGE